MDYPTNTVGYWLSKIEDPEVRKKAIANVISFHSSHYLREEIEGISSTWDALCSCFDWEYTKETWEYWHAVAAKYLNPAV